jgi:hypothetical protein
MILELVSCDRCGAVLCKRMPGSTILPPEALRLELHRRPDRHYCSPRCCAAAVAGLRKTCLSDGARPRIRGCWTGDGKPVDVGGRR